MSREEEQREREKQNAQQAGTPNWETDANSLLGVSLAVCKAGAIENGMPLYLHIAVLADNFELAIQEFMILPFGVANLKKAMCIGAEVHQNLKNVINKKHGKDATDMGDGSMFIPNILENKKSFSGQRKCDLDLSKYITSDKLTNLYKFFIKDYPKSCNCLLLKVNQIDSEMTSFQASKGLHGVSSLWDTEDTFIAGLVVGLCSRNKEELDSKAKFVGRNFRNPIAR
ncbi:unnamed protein product [Nyctereutes procyonoides]|uniref:phosphopyruvate hydratase n=1 Tax=Nyctereutes procyonoides TaxID=34880 RepID=A0A811Y2V7_NYCPR|nr:unnamed protein product [Nyctereutes procyonoides]